MQWLIVAGVVSLVFGILFLFSREMLLVLSAGWDKLIAYVDEKLRRIRVLGGGKLRRTWISRFLNQTVLSADETIIGARKILGIFLLIIAVYILYSVYLIVK